MGLMLRDEGVRELLFSFLSLDRGRLGDFDSLFF